MWEHSVVKWKIYCHQKNISSNQLFSNFFSKNVAFTKFLPKMSESEIPWFRNKCLDFTEFLRQIGDSSKFTQFPHCVPKIINIQVLSHSTLMIRRNLLWSFWPLLGCLYPLDFFLLVQTFHKQSEIVVHSFLLSYKERMKFLGKFLFQIFCPQLGSKHRTKLGLKASCFSL